MSKYLRYNEELKAWEWVKENIPEAYLFGNRLDLKSKGVVAAGVATIQNLDVGTLATLQAALIKGVGTIQNVNVGTLATLRAINVAGQGSVANLNSTAATITGLNVGTLATLRDLLVGATGTLQSLNIGTLARIQQMALGGGTVSKFDGFVASTPLANLGTQLGGVATAVASVLAGDRVLAIPKGTLVSGVIPAQVSVVGSGYLDILLLNALATSVASQPPIGWDVSIIRH